MLVGFERPAVGPVGAGPRTRSACGALRSCSPTSTARSPGSRRPRVELLSAPQTMAMGPGLPDLRFVCLRGPDDEVIELIEM